MKLKGRVIMKGIPNVTLLCTYKLGDICTVKDKCSVLQLLKQYLEYWWEQYRDCDSLFFLQVKVFYILGEHYMVYLFLLGRSLHVLPILLHYSDMHCFFPKVQVCHNKWN